MGDTDERFKDGKRGNQAISHFSYLSKVATQAANLPVNFFFNLPSMDLVFHHYA